MLLEAGANPAAQDKVMQAAQWVTCTTLSLLQGRGHLYNLPPTPHTQRGWTPLHWAAVCGSAPVVSLLLATPGVDPLTCTRVRGGRAEGAVAGPSDACTPHLLQRWDTALDMAHRYEQADAVAVLKADPRIAAALAAAQAFHAEGTGACEAKVGRAKTRM